MDSSAASWPRLSLPRGEGSRRDALLAESPRDLFLAGLSESVSLVLNLLELMGWFTLPPACRGPLVWHLGVPPGTFSCLE